MQDKNVITISGVHKSFGNNHVLRGIDLDVVRGENVVVLGRSGIGKSVLIKIICGLLQQDSGMVRVLGEDVASLNGKALRALRLRIGFSFQGSALYDSMTVGENLEFPLIRIFRKQTIRERAKRVDAVLEAVGLRQSINQMPSELSGGQRKRIGIGRTLILHPEIMLYDEPTAGLDPISSVEIIQLIKKAKEEFKVSSVIITHDLTCAKEAGDQIAMLLEGRFLSKGSFENVFHINDERVRGFYNYNFIQ
jgi:phospholipid/cholesterol/gamma-HCH transport system ATP-binding protein